MKKAEIESLFASFNSIKVLIVGDAMIDSYMWGKINRMSPEAPVPVVEIEKYENRLGGAANVALNLKSLGATPILCSVVGDGFKGKLLKQLMEEEQLVTSGIMTEANRKTTVKTRVISNNKHQIRIDEEDTFDLIEEEKFLDLVTSFFSDVQVIILQDYNKGVLTTKIIQHIIQQANLQGIPTIVDPKIKNFPFYKNCTIFKPNLKEIKEGFQMQFDENNPNELQKATQHVLEQLQAQGIFLTLSEKGVCMQTNTFFSHTNAEKRNIVDVSGAGDTVIATASLCLASQLNFDIISKFANLAGGLVCEQVGVVPINKNNLQQAAITFFNTSNFSSIRE